MYEKQLLRAFALTAGLLAATTLSGISSTAAAAGKSAETKPQSSSLAERIPPNIVVILLDDAGFGQSGTFGGPATTPTLDKLAAQGLRYNRFHVSALCSPTRAALLTGRNDHAVGFGAVTQARTDDPGYNMIWPESAASIADVLRTHGYATAAFGKWHNTPEEEISPAGPFDRWPTGLGFDYFYGFMDGLEDHWEPSRLYRGTTAVEPSPLPDEGYYLTSDLVNDAIDWVRTQRTLAPDKPYFMYFASGATHWPHQVPKEYIDRYRGRFDQGWDALREETFARQKVLGVIPADARLTPRPAEISAWDDLSPDQKRVSARQMEVFAAFLEFTDREIGRMITAVQEAPGGDNTLILYIAGDNGAQPGPNENQLPDAYIQQQLAQLDDIGGKRIPGTLGSGWALAANTPFQWAKFFGSHLGGTRDPLVVSWPAGIKDQGGVRSQYAHVVDVAPTLYELAGIRAPDVFAGVEQLPMDGTSFAYSFDSPDSPSHHDVQVFEAAGNRSIYHDGWLAAARHMHFDRKTGAILANDDFEADRWELYNLTDDFSQARDLAGRYPEKLKELRQLFDREARRTNIYPLRNFSLPPVLPTRADQRSEYVFHPGLPRLSAIAAPHFYEASYAITVDITVPQEKAEGIVMSYGSRRGGFALYARDGKLVYEANDGKRHTAVTSREPLTAGNATVLCEFIKDEPVSGGRSDLAVGTVRLYLNGSLVAEQPGVRQAFSFISISGGTFGLGRAYGSPVSNVIGIPGTFNGNLKTVHVQLK